MRLRSGSPWRCGGLKKDGAHNGTPAPVLSAEIWPCPLAYSSCPRKGTREAPPRSSEIGVGGRRVWLVNSGKGRAWEEGRSSGQHQLRMAGWAAQTPHKPHQSPAYSHGASLSCLDPQSIHSLCTVSII
ncbi:hypothetical protein HPG69_006467 [Diceros bicornis minor]|uniref:Uncharacterized protein n=1 Tax=Diceros bicornis minor TaxID=77932 RepID=A0A7J7EXP4_DICBM|nr:hypothetical protein HPG69_006467 [Diceros bicornis minor]